MNHKDVNRTVAIILAAGSGTRMNAGITKQKMTVLGKSLLLRSALAFEKCDDISAMVVVAREDEIAFARGELSSISKLLAIVPGGTNRAESAKRGLLSIPHDTDFVAIHDAARPLITTKQISDVVNKAYETGAATAVSVVTDTVKCVDGAGRVLSTVPRDSLRCAQTPQVFSLDLYKRAIFAAEDLSAITDDNMLLERISVPVYAVDVGKENIKVTTPGDLKYAEFLLLERGESHV